jgi:threonylcarbamoyladenosine tRNA methylthiotransferase MtaB
VLFESDEKEGYMHGFTKNYVKVRAKYDPLLVNEIKTVRLLNISNEGEVDVEEVESFVEH